MATTGDQKIQELNFIFKSLAERGKEGELYKKYNAYFTCVFLRKLTSMLNKTENRIVIQAYGSAAEDLMCYERNDVGDVDIMIFPNSVNLTIHEELLEYSRENPLHVRIKGSDHPVLQSCLVEHTQHVATSVVKNFQPEIFGVASPYLVSFADFIYQVLLSLEKFSPIADHYCPFTAHLKNNATSPAVTLNMSESLGTISQICEQWEMSRLNSKESQHLPFTVDLAEGVVRFMCKLRGRCYTRKQAEILDNIALKVFSNFPQIHSADFLQERDEKIGDHLGEIESRSQTEAVQFVTPEASDKETESGSHTGNYSGVTSLTTDGPCVTATPQCCDDDQRSPEALESASRQSTMQRNSPENCHQLSDQPMSKQVTEAENNGEEIMKNGDRSEGENESNTERQPLAQKGELNYKNPPCNLEDDENKTREDEERREDQKINLEITAMCNRLVEHLFTANRTRTQEIELKNTEEGQLHERVKLGMDIIPAFRARGWPKVAREWIKRERKWPSPDIVDKVVQEGFHLVVKPPKNSGNPDCDFRISFSHAEYLLSQEMNHIQRECYRCLKKFHRAYLCTQPKSLVSFHLKNILLQTIEETGAEMWTERNRAKCMMKLLGNLLTALTKKDLRHFFVREYNLFGEDYIENPEILESLAGKVEQIMENPTRFSNELIQNQEDTRQVEKEGCVSKRNPPNSDPTMSTKPVTEQHAQQEKKFKELPSNVYYETELKQEKVAVSLQDDITSANTLEEAILSLLQRFLDPSVENPFDARHILPCDVFSLRPVQPHVVNNTDDIPLD